jgi:hypothetical protein
MTLSEIEKINYDTEDLVYIRDFPVDKIKILEPDKVYDKKRIRRVSNIISCKNKKNNIRRVPPVIIGEDNYIIDRQLVFMLLRKAGYRSIPVIKIIQNKGKIDAYRIDRNSENLGVWGQNSTG